VIEDSPGSGIYNTTAAFHKRIGEMISEVVDDGVVVALEDLDSVLRAGGYPDPELVCIASPELSFERDTNDPGNVLLVMRFIIDIYVEQQRDLPTGQLPEPIERLYEILDDVLPVVVYSDVHGYQMIIDSAIPQSRSEMTQKQYRIETTIEKQMDYSPCQ
jgi:hypothetical protein